MTAKRKKALVLSGGGGRGAYHVGVLRFLEEQEWLPDIVVGTSIGAVNGAALASGHNAHSLWALWKRLKTGDVERFMPNLLSARSLLDTSPLRKTLLNEGWLDFERINSAEPPLSLRITATEVATGQLHIFGNTPDDRDKGRLQQTEITIDHIIASCSIPLVYPATELGGRVFWDGAVMANTPLGAAIDAGADEIIVVMMTPHDTEPDEAKEPPKNLLTAAGMMLDWFLMGSFRADLRMFRLVNEMVQMRDELVQQPEQVHEERYRVLPEPVIVAPRQLIPAERIITYSRSEHEKLWKMGYEDARRAWKTAEWPIEGQ